MSTFTPSITSFSRPSKLPVVVCLLILFSSPHLHTRENHLMSHKCGWAVAIRSSRLECESKNVSRKRFNSGKYSDTDDNSALLLHSKSVGNLMVIWYGVLPVYLEKLESEKTQAIRLKKRHTYTCIACSGTFNTLATKFVLHMITVWSNPAFVVIFRMYGLFQTTFYFGYMALFSLGLGIMCGKHCSWLLSLKCLDIVRRSYMFITSGKYNFPCVQQVHLGMPGQVPSSRRFILR